MSDTMEQKQQLVRAIRMLEQADMMDYNGHGSIRLANDRMLINSGNSQRRLMTVDDICAIDMDGNVIEGKGKPPLEFHLHAGIYKARADVDAIIHSHPSWSTILTTAGVEYLPVYAQGTLVYPLPVLDSPDSISNAKLAKRLADTIGNRPAALMKAHGAVTTGKTILEAFVLLVYLEDNAYRQYMAQQVGKPYCFTEEEIAICHEKLWNPGLFQKAWDHFSAKLDASA